VPRKKSEANKAAPEVLTFTEAHEFLRVSHQTIYKLMNEGLPSHKLGKKRVFFKDDLIRWIKEH
jgi:excisionase family DNA binding protein